MDTDDEAPGHRLLVVLSLIFSCILVGGCGSFGAICWLLWQLPGRT